LTTSSIGTANLSRKRSFSFVTYAILLVREYLPYSKPGTVRRAIIPTRTHMPFPNTTYRK